MGKASKRRARPSRRGRSAVAAPVVVRRGVGAASPQKRGSQAAFVPGKLYVRFNPGAVAGARAALSAGPRALAAVRAALPEAVTGPLDYLRDNCGMKRMQGLFSRQAPSARKPAALSRGIRSPAESADSKRESLRGFNLVEMDERRISDALLRRLNASRAVALAERVPNRWMSMPAAADPHLNLQWGLRAINWFTARRPDAAAVSVAVLDTGIDRRHPELRPAVDEYHYRDSARDLVGHGTHVSGIVAAAVNNGIGIAGVANCRLHVWKVFTDPRLNRDALFDDEAYTDALNDLLDTDIRAVNMSFGGTESSETERLALEALIDDGKVVVAAMGNEFEEGNPTEYPAAYRGVLAVGAIAETRERASFSNTGRHIDVVAPGVNILSTVPRYAFPRERPERNYAAWPGTSMAAPHVTGAAALVAARYPQLTVAQIIERIRATAQKLPGMRGRSFTPAYGTGLLDLADAVR
jgi:hypothetical protein